MEVIPESFIKFLDKWEVKVLIIISLVLQILLIMLGNRRKYVCKLWIRIILWCAYLLADLVAIVSLGIIGKNTLAERQKPTNDNELMWFWAQFFLLHLGGPDTITAYSLEDNELWLRRLAGMVIYTGLAFYVLLFAFPGSKWLLYMNLLIFIAGLIKYGERLSTLCAASSENFRDSMLKEPEAGPNFPKFMEEYTLKKAEGFAVGVDEVIDIPVLAQHAFPNEPGIREAYDLFLTFKRLFADAILSFQDRDSSQSYFQKLSGEQAFVVVETELGFMFDVLYTKASTVYNVGGYVLRMITFSFTLLAWIAFQFLCEKRKYTTLDVAITHLLLGVATYLEIYAVWILICSDWTSNRLSRGGDTTRFTRLIRRFQQPSRKRWSKKMAQHNLLDLCVRHKSAVCPRSREFLWRIRRLAKIDSYIEKHWHKSFFDVSPELKDLIFSELNSYRSGPDPASMWNRKGSFTLEKNDFLSLDWIRESEFDQRILLWHIATDICYSLEWNDEEANTNMSSNERKQISDHSKHISDYMLYLLIACPFMLPIGIGMIMFRDTCAEAREFLSERHTISSKVEACKKLLEVNTEVPPRIVKGDRSKSVLFDACILAKVLLAEKEHMWEIISQVWVEMLAHTATHCNGSHHARQLRKGGELLTHVWLLMAHLGITEQFQISQGHARAKLRVR
ncbi:hypothetical protein C2S53_006201 [Perilla frutescens var. hirtella]|uniref:DUF4220 domain-containing protein n=1 Tax=Perilla frutescens var. hirtella TaxID=608512 RepID=A0AAD4IUC4_PERFH|nr:hypothetical protein C2S53_006201 [Perilla frutescens var. hirtella]